MPIPLGVLAVAGAGGGGGPTPPAFLTSAKVWLDASDTSTITASGGSVSQWNNKGTLGNFTQATASLQPTTGTQTINGLNVLDFAGDALVSADASSSYVFLHDGTTYFVAYVVDWTPTADRYNVLLATQEGSSSQIGIVHGNDNRTSIGRTNRMNYVVFGGVNPDKVMVVVEDDGFYSANDLIYTNLVDPDNATAANRFAYYQNTTTGTVANTRTGTTTSGNPNFTLRVGYPADADYNFGGQLGELIIVSGADATDANRILVRDYLNSKWGIY